MKTIILDDLPRKAAVAVEVLPYLTGTCVWCGKYVAGKKVVAQEHMLHDGNLVHWVPPPSKYRAMERD
jgi:hypothetical protein